MQKFRSNLNYIRSNFYIRSCLKLDHNTSHALLNLDFNSTCIYAHIITVEKYVPKANRQAVDG